MNASWLMPAAIVLASTACAQNSEVLQLAVDAYRTGPTFERVTIEAPREVGPPRRSVVLVAVRPGPDPALALVLGQEDPLRVLAEPGRLFVWRQAEPSRVFAAPLAEPFGREAIERVLPVLLLPQIDLALAPAPEGLLAVMPALSWSRRPGEGPGQLVGVSPGAALTLSLDAEGRLSGYEARREGRVVARAKVEAVAQADGPAGIAWFDAPDLDGAPVRSLADLGRPAGQIGMGQPFGHMLGTDARQRPATLRAMAGEAERLVVLAVDVRSAERRARIAGALAEADLGSLAELLDLRIVILAMGEPSSASLLARVSRSSSVADRVRVLAVASPPAWLPVGEGAGDGVAMGIDAASWVLASVQRVGQDVSVDEDPFEDAQTARESKAPAPLADRIAEAVGAAGRGL